MQRRSISSLAVCLFMLLAALGASAQDSSGIHPLPAPGDYQVSQETPRGSFAASFVPAAQVKHLFAVDISKDYLVLEVALFPKGREAADLSSGDFIIPSGAKGDLIHASDPSTVASVIQRKNAPRWPGEKQSDVYTEASVGYGTGTDPYTGRRVHDVYGGAGVGVERGPGYGTPPPPPRPGATSEDRVELQGQLSAKGLPDGTYNKPVAGYLYFPAGEVKKKDGKYWLVYLGDPSGKVTLAVPTKGR
jgi:hypothetical protein